MSEHNIVIYGLLFIVFVLMYLAVSGFTRIQLGDTYVKLYKYQCIAFNLIMSSMIVYLGYLGISSVIM